MAVLHNISRNKQIINKGISAVGGIPGLVPVLSWWEASVEAGY